MQRKLFFDLKNREPACFIFGAGSFFGLQSEPKDGDLIIAADGGLRRTEECGLCADFVIGDFDSLGDEKSAEEECTDTSASLKVNELKRIFSGNNSRTVRLPSIKDMSDSAAAIAFGIEKGYRLFYFYGCTGGRLDHTLASIQDIARLAENGMQGYLFDGKSVLTAVCGNEKNGECALFFPEGMQGLISVFSHSECCRGVEEINLKYSIPDQKLCNTFPLGLSNEFTGKAAAVKLKEGTAVILFSL